MPDREESRPPTPNHDLLRAEFLEGAASLYRLAHRLDGAAGALPLPPEDVLTDLFEADTQPPEAVVVGILGSVIVDQLRPAAVSLIDACRELPR